MRKYERDFAVNVLAFTLFTTLATTGVVMHFRLPKGSGESLTIWGLDRHGWGGVHFWVAAAMLAVLALHLFLNWHWIVAVVRGRPRERGIGPRVASGLVALGVLIALAGAMLLSPVRQTGRPGEPETERVGSGVTPAPAPLSPSGAVPAAAAPVRIGGAADTTRCAPVVEPEVHGTMSLDEVARATGVPAEHLIRELRLPSDVSRAQALRELTGAHGFRMDDVRRVVADYLRHC